MGCTPLLPLPMGSNTSEKCNIESKEYEIDENIVSKGIKSDENTLFSVMSEGKTVKQILQPSVRPLPFKKKLCSAQPDTSAGYANKFVDVLFIYIYILVIFII